LVSITGFSAFFDLSVAPAVVDGDIVMELIGVQLQKGPSYSPEEIGGTRALPERQGLLLKSTTSPAYRCIDLTPCQVVPLVTSLRAWERLVIRTQIERRLLRELMSETIRAPLVCTFGGLGMPRSMPRNLVSAAP
jgi:hypothetical protein